MLPTDLTPGLVFALGWLALTTAAVSVLPWILVARMIRKSHIENAKLTTAVLAMARHSAAEGLAQVRAHQEAAAEAPPPPQTAPPGRARAMRPVGS